MSRSRHRDLISGLLFLAPNICGFLAFVLLPLLFSLFLAFTNWDLQLHNMFKNETLRFVGIDNFVRLLTGEDFRRYLGNTLFLMMVVPFGIAGSLMAALLLSQDLRGGGRAVWAWLLATALLVTALGTLLVLGAQLTAMTTLLIGLGGLIFVVGTLGGNTVHRTLFYMPHFTAGVATFLLWKQMYSPHTGPINNALRPLLRVLEGAVLHVAPGWVQGGIWLATGLMTGLILFGIRSLYRQWRDGDIGIAGVALALGFLLLPAWRASTFFALQSAATILGLVGTLATLMLVGLMVARKRPFVCGFGYGLGNGLMLGLALMVVQMILLGLGNVAWALPEWAVAGLDPPQWLQRYHWAKPALMLMALWAAIGSNNMILYLAGLSNVPPELYEASSIDGASRFQTFWHVTWPQLAPVTFFIVVMSVIAGLQGGFEMARSMTEGGPAGATTTLSYYIYTEGFETGRLGYASAVSWALFLLVFTVTLFNWKFGNRYVND